MSRVYSGTRTRALRKAAGTRVEHVAIRLRRSVYTVLEYEHGRVVPPTAVLASLADFYRCSIDDFFAEEESDDAANPCRRRTVRSLASLSHRDRARLVERLAEPVQ